MLCLYDLDYRESMLPSESCMTSIGIKFIKSNNGLWSTIIHLDLLTQSIQFLKEKENICVSPEFKTVLWSIEIKSNCQGLRVEKKWE